VELTILLGAAAALGCLVLGVLELLWPTIPHRPARPPVALARRRPAASVAPRAAAPVRLMSPERLVALVERARAETDAERRTTALRVAILTLERWRASSAAPDDVVRMALDRARAELWADYQRIAFRRLAATVPWRASALRAGDGAR
jgi:hypothetical protein